MTHDELFHLGRPQAPENEEICLGPIEHPELHAISELHFPLHFSKLDRARPVSVSSEQSANSTLPPLDYSNLGGSGRDFLVPLLQPVIEQPELGSLEHTSSLLSCTSSLFTPTTEYIPPQNMQVDDAMPEPFASVASHQANPNHQTLPLGSSRHSNVLPDPVSSQYLHLVKLGEVDTYQVSSMPMSGPSVNNIREIYPDLDEISMGLFCYFRDTQSTLMSVSPLNHFRTVFLAFSLRYKVVMYGILAWAAWHQGNHEELAKNYFNEASKMIRNETLNSRSKEEILAALLVLASAKICSGDTSDWRPYLVLAGETIHVHGGLMSFMESESVRWLLKNYAYHEVLASSSLDLPKLFSANDFEIIFNQPSSSSLPDTLCACCQKIFVVLERINELTRKVRLLLLSDSDKSKRLAQKSSLPTPQPSTEPTEEEVEDIYSAAHELETKIWALEPSQKTLQHLSEHDLRLQIALFDVFKLAAILHLYQSVLRVNSSAISMRVVGHRLHRSINPLFGTMVEGILIFPLFILGIASTERKCRINIEERFTGMSERLCARNVKQSLVLVKKVWALDNFGHNHVDWNELVDREGLHFCFA